MRFRGRHEKTFKIGLLLFEGVKLPHHMSRRGAIVCHRGSEMQILEPSPAALLSIRLDSYCYFCTELEREAVPNHFGPKKMVKRYAQRCFLFFSTFALRPQRKHFRRHFKAIIMVKWQYFALGVAKNACKKTPRIIHIFLLQHL